MQFLALAVAAPLLVLLAIVVIHEPVRILLAAYAAVLPFGSAIRVPFLPLPRAFGTASSLLGLMCSAAVLAHLILARRRASRLLPHVPAAVLLLGWSAFGFLWSVNAQHTRDELLVFAALVALYVLVSVSRHTVRDIAWFEHALVAGAALSAVYGIYLLRSGQLKSPDRVIPRFGTAGGTEGGDPGVTAATLVLPLVVALHAAYSAKRTLRRVLNIAASALIVAAIALTSSRGGLVGALIGAVVLATVLKTGRVAKYVLLSVAVGLLALSAAPAGLRNHLTAESSTGRSDIWRVAARGCQQHCLVGSGWATFPDVYHDVLLENPELRGDTTKNFKAHNILLAMAVEGGVVGLALMIALLLLVARDLGHLPRERRGPPMAALAGVLAANMFLSNFAFKYFWLVLIYASMCALTERTDDKIESNPTLGLAPEAKLADAAYVPS